MIKKNNKTIIVSFEELEKVKKEYDQVNEKARKIMDNDPTNGSLLFTLASRDKKIMEFVDAGRNYYDNPKLSVEDILSMYEEESKYRNSVSGDESVAIAHVSSYKGLKGYDEEADYIDEEELDQTSVLEIKKGC